MSRAVQHIKNFYFPQSTFQQAYSRPMNSPDVKRNLSNYITRVQFARIRQDIQSWRNAIQQAEQMFYPFRSEMQRLYLDTILNEHVTACWNRRKNLTLLRDFKICDENGNEDEKLKLLFRNNAIQGAGDWFDKYLNYTLDALGFGYSLISLGDVINNAFPGISIIRRENISPDRHNVSSLPQMVGGIDFLEPPYSDWHIWVPTPSITGRETCGYGLFYIIARAEIFLRNNISFNADYNEVYGQPIRKGKTTKTDPDERDEFERQLDRMGANPWILLDEGQDELEIIQAPAAGTGHQTFDNFEKRLEQKISKVLLGHADALDSTPGKLGSGQKGGGEESPQQQALDEIQVKDGIFVENATNGELIPRLQRLGFPIPPNYHFEFLNNKENEEFRRKEDESNQMTANIALAMSQAGLQMDAKYFEDRTSIPTTLVSKSVSVAPNNGSGEDAPVNTNAA